MGLAEVELWVLSVTMVLFKVMILHIQKFLDMQKPITCPTKTWTGWCCRQLGFVAVVSEGGLNSEQYWASPWAWRGVVWYDLAYCRDLALDSVLAWEWMSGPCLKGHEAFFKAIPWKHLYLLLRLDCFILRPSGYSGLGRKCPICGCHRAQDNDIKWFCKPQQCVSFGSQSRFVHDTLVIRNHWGERERRTTNIKHIFLLPAYTVSGAFKTIFIWWCVRGILF